MIGNFFSLFSVDAFIVDFLRELRMVANFSKIFSIHDDALVISEHIETLTILFEQIFQYCNNKFIFGEGIAMS